jgi:hypothetical protein
VLYCRFECATPCEDKGEVVKDSFYEELRRVLFSFLGKI